MILSPWLRRRGWWVYLLFAKAVCSIAGHEPIHKDAGPAHIYCRCERCGDHLRRVGDRWWRH